MNIVINECLRNFDLNICLIHHYILEHLRVPGFTCSKIISMLSDINYHLILHLELGKL